MNDPAETDLAVQGPTAPHESASIAKRDLRLAARAARDERAATRRRERRSALDDGHPFGRYSLPRLVMPGRETLPSADHVNAATIRDPEAYAKLYDQFINNPDPVDYQVVDVIPPVVIVEGIAADAQQFLGAMTPPSVRSRRAVQNIVDVVRHENVLFDPTSGSFFALQCIQDTVRPARPKELMALMGTRFDALEVGFVAMTRSFQNYYHWLVEVMPRAMRLGQEFPAETLLTHKAVLPFHDGLGLVREPSRTRELRLPTYFETAITTTITTNFLPAYRVSRHSLPAADILLFPLQVAALAPGHNRRVFISRRDAQTRVLNDERVLIKALEERGFECPVMSDLTFQEQVELCANAEIIVSTHGAGLTNMLFRAGKPCKVVEIVPARRWPLNNIICMYNLSQVCRFEYYIYDCGYPSEDERLLSQNWHIDHKDFIAFIDTLIK